MGPPTAKKIDDANGLVPLVKSSAKIVHSAATTVSAALPVTPAVVARMDVEPVAAGVARPDGEIAAVAGTVELHVNVCPGMTTAPAPSAVAVNCCVWLTLIVAVAGTTVTLVTVAATGGTTVSVAFPTFAPLVPWPIA